MKKSLLPILIVISSCSIVNTSYPKNETLKVGAIPDQNPEKLNRLYNLLAKELSQELKVKVKYIPVTNYAAAVTGFRTGSLDFVWFGGLTGVQARLQTKAAKVIAQRNIDKKFHSVFIANKTSGIPTLNNIRELKVLKGKRFTFGSENSTSGRLMPQYFLEKAGVNIYDFEGRRAGFSGSHDATLTLVNTGAYEAGVLNEQIWKARVKNNNEKYSNTYVILRSPSYHDYHWLLQGDIDKRFGPGFSNKIKNTLLNLDKNSDDHKKILDLFGAEKFVPSSSKNYNSIEKIGRAIGKIR